MILDAVKMQTLEFICVNRKQMQSLPLLRKS